MKVRQVVFLILFLLLMLVFWLNKSNKINETESQTTTSDSPYRRFNRNVSNIEYTRHANCRMKCRRITKAEVEDIMKHGTVNYKKSDVKDRPCPTYALEGYTHQDNQHVRIIFAQCDNKTKVVTCIDLEHEFNCDCN